MAPASPEEATGAFAALRDEQFVVLTTFRRSGTPVPTTVWFALVGGHTFHSATRNIEIARTHRQRRLSWHPSG